jgi:hypothetical protein
MVSAKVRNLAVYPKRQSAWTVYVFLDDGNPVIRKVSSELELNSRVVDRNVARQDQRVSVALLPKAVYDRGHEAKNASRALELGKGGPIVVEPVEYLWVNGISRSNSLLVVGIPALGRKLLVLCPVEVVEAPRNVVAGLELLWVE